MLGFYPNPPFITSIDKIGRANIIPSNWVSDLHAAEADYLSFGSAMITDGLDDARVRLMFSLTAHERFDVLFDQLYNIFEMCPGSQVVLHLNHALWHEMTENTRYKSLLLYVLSNPSIVVNPEHLGTKWAHMFHAHISNINLITTKSLDYDRLVLLSSGDIIVRPGLEAYASHWDVVVNDDTDPDWPWQPKVDADPVVKILQSLAGTNKNSRSAHEGTFYSRQIVERMVEVLNEVVPDWNYNESYPKEEVFFPTLSFMFPEARRCSLNYHHLGFDSERDYAILCQVLNVVGLTEPSVSPVLARWAKRGLVSSTPAPFILSRLPRRRDSLLRMLLHDVSPEGASSRARVLASRLRPSDIAEFDKRIRWPKRIAGKASKVLSRIRGAK